MLNNWYGMASYCQDSNGFCRHGGICRPNACPMMAIVPGDDEENEKEGNDDNEVS